MMNVKAILDGAGVALSFLAIQDLTKLAAILAVNKFVLKNNFKTYQHQLSGSLNIPKQKEARIDDIDYEKFEKIREYIEILEENLTPKEKKSMHNNLASIDIKKRKCNLLLNNAGYYYPEKNEICFDRLSVIGHELIHMASSQKIDEKTFLCGFNYNDKDKRIGAGLNEGYTELLASRFFNKDSLPHAYKSLVKIASLLECFFEPPEYMRVLFFTNDMPRFIQYMEQYAPKEEIIKLIRDIDNMHDLSLLLFPVHLASSKKIQDTLNKWFKAKVSDPERVEKFDDIYVRGTLKQENSKTK